LDYVPPNEAGIKFATGDDKYASRRFLSSKDYVQTRTFWTSEAFFFNMATQTCVSQDLLKTSTVMAQVHNPAAEDASKNILDAEQLKNGITNQLSSVDPVPEYKIRESPMGTKRKLKVVFMGMGCSGINFASQLQKRMENIDLTIYEKNDDVGGTWLENKYPGCACDIPSVSYQYTWARKPDWSHYYSGAKEIFEYFKCVAVENDVLKYVKFKHRISRAEWLDQEGKWKITIMRNDNPADTVVDYADFFINAGGFLNTWKWPQVKNLETFQGPRMHTAAWDNTVDLKDKKVLVLGIGSSGVQVVPAILDTVSQLYVVARSATWITAGFAPKYAGKNGENFAYSEETKQRFREDPQLYLSYCKGVESELNQRFKIVVNGSTDAINARSYSEKEMQRKLTSRPDLLDHLMPKDFGIGCRRPTPGNGFLEALANPKTTTLTQELDSITPTGFIAGDGTHHECDIIVCATGFDTSFRPQFPIICNGRNVQDDYNDPNNLGYLGIGASEVPNYFVFCGLYGPIGHGSVCPMVEAYTNYVFQILEKAQVEDIKKMQVKRSVAQQFSAHADLYVNRTAWSGPCSSWFKAGDKNRKPTIWSGSRIHYLRMLQKPRFEDFDIEYLSGNAFNYLGDGFHVSEYDGSDLTWYYGFMHGEDKQPEPSEFPPALY
jgi:cation diffusion facilitator CzcD-associated flavoprotein CzcO